MPPQNEKRSSGAPLKGEIKGFLSPARQEFLRTKPSERRDKYGDNTYRQHTHKIRQKTKSGLEDLLLVIQNNDVDELNKIFTQDYEKNSRTAPIDVFYKIISELTKKVGSHELGRDYPGPAYLNLIRAITIGMDRHQSGKNSSERFKIEAKTILINEPSF
ncbi:MAG: hypothetical protein WC502_09690 [Methanolinea sp.]